MRILFAKYEKQIKYVLVGVWNTLFTYALFVALYYVLAPFKLHYLVVLALRNAISITNAYFSYKFVVFKTERNYLREYARFWLVYGGMTAVNLAVLPLLVEKGRMSPLLSQGLIDALAAVAGYFAHNYFSFKPAQEIKIETVLALSAVGES